VLLTVNGQPARLEETSNAPGGTWVWKWVYEPAGNTSLADLSGATVSFYRDCNTGCVEVARSMVGHHGVGIADAAPLVRTVPTKLGVVFANPARDWHGRAGWAVELTYVKPAAGIYWSIDQLAGRVQAATAKGLRVLVRVDYDRGQSIPPADDNVALAEYLGYLKRLARDERLRDVYGYVIGSGFNAADSNALSPTHLVTPEWYARVFNGYGQAVSHEDNAVQAIRTINQRTRVLVGPVRPWVNDQDGVKRNAVDAPWLNYMDTLAAALDEGTRAKSAAGIAFAAPDGFALHAPGRTSGVDLAGNSAADEPGLNLRRPEWGQAQAGFRVYQDWLRIINAYPTTRGLPAFITSTNTFTPDEGSPPAQNYPRGWLTAALKVIDDEPQVQALCWYLDGPLGDSQWDLYSLSRQQGRLLDADEEFDSLLQSGQAGRAGR
jgi:hypothetical protein